MFRWYRNATKCYVYLSDVPTTDLIRTHFAEADGSQEVGHSKNSSLLESSSSFREMESRSAISNHWSLRSIESYLYQSKHCDTRCVWPISVFLSASPGSLTGRLLLRKTRRTVCWVSSLYIWPSSTGRAKITRCEDCETRLTLPTT